MKSPRLLTHQLNQLEKIKQNFADFLQHSKINIACEIGDSSFMSLVRTFVNFSVPNLKNELDELEKLMIQGKVSELPKNNLFAGLMGFFEEFIEKEGRHTHKSDVVVPGLYEHLRFGRPLRPHDFVRGSGHLDDSKMDRLGTLSIKQLRFNVLSHIAQGVKRPTILLNLNTLARAFAREDGEYQKYYYLDKNGKLFLKSDFVDKESYFSKALQELVKLHKELTQQGKPFKIKFSLHRNRNDLITLINQIKASIKQLAQTEFDNDLSLGGLIEGFDICGDELNGASKNIPAVHETLNGLMMDGFRLYLHYGDRRNVKPSSRIGLSDAQVQENLLLKTINLLLDCPGIAALTHMSALDEIPSMTSRGQRYLRILSEMLTGKLSLELLTDESFGLQMDLGQALILVSDLQKSGVIDSNGFVHGNAWDLNCLNEKYISKHEKISKIITAINSAKKIILEHAYFYSPNVGSALNIPVNRLHNYIPLDYWKKVFGSGFIDRVRLVVDGMVRPRGEIYNDNKEGLSRSVGFDCVSPSLGLLTYALADPTISFEEWLGLVGTDFSSVMKRIREKRR
jgi:hypothetical protein